MASAARRIVLPILALLAAGCREAPEAKASDAVASAPGQVQLVGQSDKYVVTGMYQPIVLDSVEHLSRNEDRVRVDGPHGSVAVSLPAEADTSQPNPRWRQISETDNDEGRLITFTHQSTLDQFAIQLPASDAELHSGAFLDRKGGDVMVFAWGENGHCYWGYVIVKPKNP
jgi:hypothetical protein